MNNELIPMYNSMNSFYRSLQCWLGVFSLVLMVYLANSCCFLFSLFAGDKILPVNTTKQITSSIPRFVSVDYIDLTKISRITKFRSGEGHDYSDDFEKNRSMKHYYMPKEDIDWTTVQITAPVTGKIIRIDEEWAGTKVEIQSEEYPSLSFALFHIKLLKPLKNGDTVKAGQILGHHIGKQTFSDIAVTMNTEKGRQLLSYFDVMTDSLFSAYQERGLKLREDAIISKEARDRDPLSNGSGQFTNRGTINNWVILR